MKILVVLLSSPIKFWGKSVKGFLSYDRTFNSDRQTNRDYSFIFITNKFNIFADFYTKKSIKWPKLVQFTQSIDRIHTGNIVFHSLSWNCLILVNAQYITIAVNAQYITIAVNTAYNNFKKIFLIFFLSKYFCFFWSGTK